MENPGRSKTDEEKVMPYIIWIKGYFCIRSDSWFMQTYHENVMQFMRKLEYMSVLFNEFIVEYPVCPRTILFIAS